MFTPENVTKLELDECFVFGSNKAGRHGAGAARLAYEEFGAMWGIGFGSTGRCFAIPTKDKNLKVLPLNEIKDFVDIFLDFAKRSPNTKFLVTKLGCGLAGYTPEDIAPMFERHTENVIIPEEFHNLLIAKTEVDAS